MGLSHAIFGRYSEAPKIEAARSGLLAMYFFHIRCTADQKEQVKKYASQHFDADRARTGITGHSTVEELPDRVRYLYYAHAMKGLRINPLYPEFFWKAIDDPLRSQDYEGRIYEIASESIKKMYGISVGENEKEPFETAS